VKPLAALLAASLQLKKFILEGGLLLLLIGRFSQSCRPYSAPFLPPLGKLGKFTEMLTSAPTLFRKHSQLLIAGPNATAAITLAAEGRGIVK
jgi:hypothetical protein